MTGMKSFPQGILSSKEAVNRGKRNFQAGNRGAGTGCQTF